ncbi:hypothetical protein Desaci_3412 [Desulfosporosinus acidiphilus SJ4]|uniref:Uncharacterized protein n=1 Tax=Desulfosporosinus acidiphilus (strain DSM 22704 / JCM 16185 / SJ4) TaxID=646529 RepID=I4D931_DESAJ|nr:hypothetical protein [Desulfosporosinus acidiphilus]AFM42305.1 hypothetical protein Desaci_3412 [Desulfosporosinus acidiphilus SJ4]
MHYQLYPQTNQTRIFTEKNSRSKIPYCTARKMRELYPDEDFVIIGEIGNFAEVFGGQDVLLTGSGKAIPIFPRGSLMKPLEWIAGYVAVGENTYVAAVRSIIPTFLRCRK